VRILLVGGRARADRLGPDPRAAAELAGALRALGHELRWLQPDSPKLAGITDPDLVRVRSPMPPFARVQSRTIDMPLEARFARLLREEGPEVVHLLAYAGGSSACTPWVADRLGVPALVDVEPALLLCHRGTLIDDQGRACREFADPARCRRCCLAPFEHGLGPLRARLARAFGWLGPFAPFATDVEFQNRLELVLGHLASARRVLVPSDAAAALLVEAGVRERLLQVLPTEQRSAERFAAIYEELRGSRAVLASGS
jgi:hypothetical protein